MIRSRSFLVGAALGGLESGNVAGTAEAEDRQGEAADDVVLDRPVGPWGTSAPCAECGQWTLVDQSQLGVAVRKAEYLDEHGRCPGCRAETEASAIRAARARQEGAMVADQQRKRTPADAWWTLAYTAIGYCTLRKAPLGLVVPVTLATPVLEAWSTWHRKRRRKEAGWELLPVPEVPSDLVWAVIDAAAEAARLGQLDNSPIGRDLRALVEGMPRELRQEVR